ncbi:MAG: c-type cytochrome [Sphingomonadales bacterium]|nr:c-type cytochrome [Sphingomonadales bacterium]
MIAALAITALAIAGCSKPAPDPVEQIVVRKPGDPAIAAPTLAAGDAAAVGKQAFAASCAACHAITADAPAGVGPTLYGVIGRKAGSLPGFAYSTAMKGSGLTWSGESIDTFLADPPALVPGTAMSAGAITDPATRQAIAAYLTSLRKGG